MTPREIKIKAVLNGYRVKVGCQEVVFDDKAKMIAELSRYLDDPAAIEKEYNDKYHFSTPPDNGIHDGPYIVFGRQPVKEEITVGYAEQSHEPDKKGGSQN